MRNKHHRAGFSLIELMVCIGIISLLIGLLMPAIQRVRGSAALIQCQANLRQIGVALHHYHNDFNELPNFKSSNVVTVEPRYLYLWPTHLLPYIEQANLWNDAVQALKVPVSVATNPPHRGMATVIPLYVCPLDRRLLVPHVDYHGVYAAFTSYVGNGGVWLNSGVLGIPDQLRLEDIFDGVSTTVMVGERPPPDTFEVGRWYSNNYEYLFMPWLPSGTLFTSYWEHSEYCYDYGDPCYKYPPKSLSPGRTDNPCDRLHYWSMHPGGANFLMADGSVHFFKYTIDDEVMRALLTRANGETVQLPDD